MAKPGKIIRDPLYNYITIDEPWLIELIDTREVQRLRRIHQLGVSHFTYPGAEHSRLAHSLGVMHLMQLALLQIEKVAKSEHGPRLDLASSPLLAAAILHDVGHGPLSHVFEPLLKINHEKWSCRVISENGTEVNDVLTRRAIPPDQVVALIEKGNYKREPWEKTLLSSQLDVDRLDYLRRDSYFTGAGYGHFDWYRIINTVSLGEIEGRMALLWPDAAKYAIEEYIFARFYMYQNVYQHKTTRGFEKMIHAAWRRAEQLEIDGDDAQFVKEIKDFRQAKDKATIDQYLALEDATLIYQLVIWGKHNDKVLSDLANRFLKRNRFKAVSDPVPADAFEDVREKWEESLHKLVASKGYDPPECYALRDDLKKTVYDPYMPETEGEQDPYNAILLKTDDGPTEISDVLTRLKAVTGKQPEWYRYYVPEDIFVDVKKLAASSDWR